MRIHADDIQPEDRDLIRRHLVAMETDNLSAVTMQHRECLLRRLSYWLDVQHGSGLGHTSVAQLEEWTQSIRRMAPESRRAYIVHARAFFAWRSKFTNFDPAVSIRPPKIPKAQPKSMDERSLGIALRGLREPVRTWVALGAFAGLRSGEIARITREDIRQDGDPVLLVVHGKGGKDRAVPVSGALWPILHKHVRGPGLLWRRPMGGPMTGQYVTKEVSAGLHALGLGYTEHAARHRFGRKMFEVTKDIRIVQELLGHESVTTTQRYTDAATPTAVKALNKIAAPLERTRRS